MPHVIVKLWPGKSEEQKRRLAQEIAKDVMNVLNEGLLAGHRRERRQTVQETRLRNVKGRLSP